LNGRNRRRSASFFSPNRVVTNLLHPIALGLNALSLACIDDDAQGETDVVLWDAELDAAVLADEGWANVGKQETDDPSVFSAYLRTLRWNAATAADRDLFQARFRAGIHQDAYQLLPLREALRLPRVNLLIADDVGAGKTVEAGLVLRELLLRRRVDFVLVAAPAGMVRQWHLKRSLASPSQSSTATISRF
jgi:hypothetical protein